MVTLTKTTNPIKLKEIKREWHFVDLKGQILGRAISQIAVYLQGKHKRNYIPNLDCGDFVVAVNCEKIKITGKKAASKRYTRYTGYPGGLRIKNYREVIIKHAVLGMLPKNKLRKKRIARLFIFKGEKHNFEDKFNN